MSIKKAAKSATYTMINETFLRILLFYLLNSTQEGETATKM